jgi:phospholipid/cholesterol/gamma-HCH transport system substrate-binding protein
MSLIFRPRVLGIVFLAMLVGAVWLTNAVFTKKFTDYEKVTLRATNIGLNLPERADVKIRGVIVGEVLETKSTTEGAEVTLGIFKGQEDIIPKNVTGSIVPKTLFGEKYVSLIVPENASSEHITAADTIPRTDVSTEVEEVLNDLYPLLTTVQPAQLNMTLNALATALEGRGDALGENLETVDAYLKRINPQIPGLVEDLRLTSEVSDTYSDVLPQVAQILDDTVTTGQTLEGREAQLAALFQDISSFSDTGRTFLDDNGEELVRLGEVSAAQLRVLARYSPQFPCLTQGIVNVGKLQAQAFRGFTLHIVLETLPRQPRAYKPDDKPRVAENRGPNCLHLPNPPWSQANPVRQQPNFNDGVDRPTGKGTSRVAPGFGDGDYRYSGTPSDAEVLKRMLDETGFRSSDLGVLLAGPLVGEAGS